MVWGEMRFTLTVATAGLMVGCFGDIGEPSGTPDGAPVDIDAAVRGSPDAPLPDAAPKAAPCGDGDASYLDPDTGHCYLWIDEPVMRDQAQASCMQVYNAHLATITSAGEDADVAMVAPDTQPDPDVASSFDSWLGGNDLVTEGTWVWDTMEPFSFTNWRDGEPNNGGTTPADPNGEDCQVYEGDNNQWDDRSCSLGLFRYICEREPE